MPSSRDEISRPLEEHRNGDATALDRLMPLVYDELRRIAAQQLRTERPDHTLRPTALVNEAYLRLLGQQEASWHDRSHFFALAARVMRNILVDHARTHRRGKRGGGQMKLALDEAVLIPAEPDLDLIALDDALKALAEKDERKCRIVELRYFGGLDIEETAEVLGVSPGTVRRDWTLAKAWLRSEMRRGGG